MTQLNRREFLRFGALVAGSAALSGCGVVGRELVQAELPAALQSPVPEPDAAAPIPPSSAIQTPLSESAAYRRLLNRAGFGPRPGALEAAMEMGWQAHIESQLAPDRIDDHASDLILRGIDLYHREAGDLANQEPVDLGLALNAATINRALTSKRQLQEAMVHFWSDHFNIYLLKNQYQVALKIIDDRDMIRPNALGTFPELLAASAASPAMLVYLDNIRNLKGEPNENYAREIMELHTLGVNGGYSQQDVQEAARALSGWTVGLRGRQQGQVFLRAEEHDAGSKAILGHHFPADQGEQDIYQLVDLLAHHPSTAQFIAAKLVRRLVADEPPPELVSEAAAIFEQSDGDIRQMVRHILLSPAFLEAPPKLKRPFHFMLSALRALSADVRRIRGLLGWLDTLGQPLFRWPTPDGYPDVASAWASNLLPRWNFALALAHDEIQGVVVPWERIMAAGNAASVPDTLNLFAGLLLGEPLDEDTMSLFTGYIGSGSLDAQAVQHKTHDAIALILSSPAFQWM